MVSNLSLKTNKKESRIKLWQVLKLHSFLPHAWFSKKTNSWKFVVLFWKSFRLSFFLSFCLSFSCLHFTFLRRQQKCCSVVVYSSSHSSKCGIQKQFLKHWFMIYNNRTPCCKGKDWLSDQIFKTFFILFQIVSLSQLQQWPRGLMMM